MINSLYTVNFYEDLLKRQETAFRSFSQMIMDSTNKRVDSVLSELQELKVSLNYSQSDIDEIKKHLRAQQKDITKQVNELKTGQAANSDCEQMDYLENQSCD